jgi:Spy/CpxP family protein refolding chaperone
VDLNASVQKAEIGLEPLLAAEQPDERKILAQIDRAAQARAELEKAHARMLPGLRRVLTQDQWTKLKADAGRGGRSRPAATNRPAREAAAATGSNGRSPAHLRRAHSGAPYLSCFRESLERVRPRS